MSTQPAKTVMQMSSPRIGPLKLRAQIMCGNDVAMGPGKADLLQAIERTGSISAAGRALGMSYKRSWDLVDIMNRCWVCPVVETIPGGSHNKGAHLTDCGRDVLRAYRALEQKLAQQASDAVEEFALKLRKEPRPRQIIVETQRSN